MTKLTLNEKTADLIREKAEQRGYDNPEAYLLDLLEADADEDVIAQNQKIREDFKLAFKEAIQGKTITREELRRRMAEDD